MEKRRYGGGDMFFKLQTIDYWKEGYISTSASFNISSTLLGLMAPLAARVIIRSTGGSETLFCFLGCIDWSVEVGDNKTCCC